MNYRLYTMQTASLNAYSIIIELYVLQLVNYHYKFNLGILGLYVCPQKHHPSVRLKGTTCKKLLESMPNPSLQMVLQGTLFYYPQAELLTPNCLLPFLEASEPSDL